MEVTIKVELSEQFLSDILVTAFDEDHGGSWYWAEPRLPKTDREPLSFAIDGNVWRAVTIIEREASGDKRKWCVVDHARVATGIQRLLDGTCGANGEILRQVSMGVADRDAGRIDASAADAIVQAAMFGELVYG